MIKFQENMKKINTTLAFALFALLVFSQVVSAGEIGDEISEEDQATFDQILEPVMKIYDLVKYSATFIAMLVLLFAGVSYMLSGSDPKKRESAKSTVMYVVLGLLVIWAAPLVVNFIIN